MIRVYIWDNNVHVGHAALSTEKYYRSFRPRNVNVYLADNEGVPASWAEDYNDDVIHKERFNRNIDINGGYEADLNNYIANDLESDFPKYHLHTANCSTVVAAMLMTAYYGHLHHHGKFDEIMWKLRSGHILFNHNNKTRNNRYFEEGFDKFEEWASLMLRKRNLAPAAFAMSLVEVWRRVIIWTPGDVERMANQMKKLIEQHGN